MAKIDFGKRGRETYESRKTLHRSLWSLCTNIWLKRMHNLRQTVYEHEEFEDRHGGADYSYNYVNYTRIDAQVNSDKKKLFKE